MDVSNLIPPALTGKTESILTVQINNGNVSTAQDQCLAHDQTQSSSTTSDYANPTLECERCKCALEVVSSATLHNLGRRVVALIRVLKPDRVICTREFSLVLGLARLAGCAIAVMLVLDRRVALLIESRDGLCEFADGGLRDGCGGEGRWADSRCGGSRDLAEECVAEHNGGCVWDQ